MPMPSDMGGYTPQQSGSGPSLTAFNPTWRDRVAQMLMGDAKPSPEKARLVEGLMGSRGLGSTGIGVADVTPAGIPMQAQEAWRAGDDRSLAMALMPGPKKPGIKGFHGSPHDFAAERLVQWPDGRKEYLVGAPDRLPDVPSGASVVQDFPLGRFREDKVGTGEGAQAYGYGVAYIAENEDVAKYYKENLVRHPAQRVMDLYGQDVDAAIAYAVRNKNPPEIVQALEAHKRGAPMPTAGGRMYEVRIDADPADFLDWDKPLSQQSENIKSAMTRLAGGEILPNYTGEDAYKSAAMQMGSRKFLEDPELSARVREAGILGVKYLDQGSRTGAGEGSRNYVPFRDDIIDIVKKYGVAFATTLYGAEAVKQATAE